MIDKLRNPKVQGALRHMLTAIGPVLASRGWIDDAMWQVYVGCGMGALGFYLSMTAPEKAK